MAEKTHTVIVTGLDTNDETTTDKESIEENVEKITWRIKDFVKVQMEEATVEKQKFNYALGKSTTCPTDWEIGLRFEPEYKNISVFFKLKKIKAAESDLRVKVKLALINNKKESAVTQIRDEKEMKQGKQITIRSFLGFRSTEVGWRNYLDENKALTLEIRFTTFHPKILSPPPDFNNALLTRVQSNYALLLEDSSTSDIKLVCSDGKEVNAHSVILKAQWPAFPSLLWAQTKLAENDNGVVEVDISEKTLKILLKYFYTGELEKNWTDSDIIHEFIDAVGKYELKEILDLLDEKIGKDDGITYNIPLLLQVKNWKLKKAEEQIVQRISKMSLLAKTGEDLLAIYGSDLKMCSKIQ